MWLSSKIKAIQYPNLFSRAAVTAAQPNELRRFESVMPVDVRVASSRHINALRKVQHVIDLAPSANTSVALSMRSALISDLCHTLQNEPRASAALKFAANHGLCGSFSSIEEGFTVFQKGANYAVILAGGKGLDVSYTLETGSGYSMSAGDISSLSAEGPEGAGLNEVISRADILGNGSYLFFDAGKLKPVDALSLHAIRTNAHNSATPIEVCFVSVMPERHTFYSNSLGVETLQSHLDNCLGDAIRTEHVDMQFGLDPDTAAEMVASKRRDIVGFSIKVIAKDSFDKIKARLGEIASPNLEGSLLAAGNTDAAKFALEIAKENKDTVVFRKEGEGPMLDLVLHRRGMKDLRQIDQAVFWDEERNMVTLNDDGEPFVFSPGYLAPNRDKIAAVLSKGGAINIEGSRGCTGGPCSFCAIWQNQGRSWRSKDAADIADEMQVLAKMGAQRMNFSDNDVFGPDPVSVSDLSRIRDLSTEILKRSLAVRLFAYARVRSIYKEGDGEVLRKAKEELMLLFKDAGMSHLFVGVDAATDAQAKRYRKDSTDRERREAIKILQKTKFDKSVIGMLVFDPFMSLKELKDKLDFIRQTGILHMLYQNGKDMSIHEDTPLARMAAEEGILNGQVSTGYRVLGYNYKDPEVAKIMQTVSPLNRYLFRAIVEFRRLYKAMPEQARRRDPLHRCIGQLFQHNFDAVFKLTDALCGGNDNEFAKQISEINASWMELLGTVLEIAEKHPGMDGLDLFKENIAKTAEDFRRTL